MHCREIVHNEVFHCFLLGYTWGASHTETRSGKCDGTFWSQVANSEGPDRYYRGLYTHRKRGCPDPALAVFDAPPCNTCVVKRRVSNTPLQALAQLNGQCVIEASAALAQRILGEGPNDDEGRMVFAFQLCATRPPDQVELDTLLLFYHKQLQRLQLCALDTVALTGDETTEDNNRIGSPCRLVDCSPCLVQPR